MVFKCAILWLELPGLVTLGGSTEHGVPICEMNKIIVPMQRTFLEEEKS
jgi:hypothetical protein